MQSLLRFIDRLTERGVRRVAHQHGRRSLLAAVEGMGNDGPWTLPQGLRRRNGKLGGHLPESQRWQAVPGVVQRLLRQDGLRPVPVQQQ